MTIRENSPVTTTVRAKAPQSGEKIHHQDHDKMPQSLRIRKARKVATTTRPKVRSTHFAFSSFIAVVIRVLGFGCRHELRFSPLERTDKKIIDTLVSVFVLIDVSPPCINIELHIVECADILVEFDDGSRETVGPFVGTVTGSDVARQVIPVRIHNENDVPGLAHDDDVLNGLYQTLLLTADIHNALQAYGNHSMLTGLFGFHFSFLKEKYVDRRFGFEQSADFVRDENLCRSARRRLVFHFRAVGSYMEIRVRVSDTNIVSQRLGAFNRVGHRPPVEVVVEYEHVITL